MSNHFGIPGIGGSLGTCAYCGEGFIREILTGETCQSVSVGGCNMAIHINKCMPALISLVANNQLSLGKWDELPACSPLRPKMKELYDQLDPAEQAAVIQPEGAN